MSDFPVYASLGLGVNSVAEIVEIIRRGERLDAIVFSDPGAEFPYTYAYLPLFNEWTTSRNYPAITVVRANRTIEQDCLTRNTLPAIAFGYKTCSQRFKREPQDKWLNNWSLARAAWAQGQRVTKLIAYDAGEPHRARPYSDEKYVVRYPLVEWGIDREGCKEIIRSAGLRLPGKSSCFFCPSMKKREIIKLDRYYPDLAARALTIEDNATAAYSVKGLGRRYSWRSLLANDEDQGKLFDAVPECSECHL